MKAFSEPKVRLEQYAMDGEIGASVLWSSYLLGDIEGKVIVDLGCGTGMLGLGALAMGAHRVLFVDIDQKAISIAQSNYAKIKSESNIKGVGEFISQDLANINLKADTVLQNPPFGTKMKHNDVVFLKKALETAKIVYSFHKSETRKFLERLAKKINIRITHVWDFEYPLKATYKFHRRKIQRIGVSCFRFVK